MSVFKTFTSFNKQRLHYRIYRFSKNDSVLSFTRIQCFCTIPHKGPVNYHKGVKFVQTGAGTITIPDEFLTTKKSKTADNLYVWEKGDGEEEVVLLHGLASTFKYWLCLIPYLNQRKYRYVAPDLLGHGRSPKGHHLNYDIDTHLYYIYRDVLDISGRRTQSSNLYGQKRQSPTVEQKKGSKGPVHLIGHDLGALLALEIASRTPKLVQQLTLISFPYAANKRDITLLKGFNPVNHVLFNNKFLCAVSCNIFRYNTWMWRPFIPFVSNKSDWLVTDSMKYCTYTPMYNTFQSCIVNYSTDQAARFLPKFGIPITLIHGEKDKITPLKQVQSFFTKYSEFCQLDVFGGAGHDLVLYNTKELAAHLNKESFH